ncbi:MAG: hypothetical protein LBP40_07485 [Campylobacteraceae bacterium]|jgi:hypothetical protein|nr:hypothetical protein [Campylobacteraceae bacterium]
MKKVLIFMLLCGALGAKVLEFEFELLDRYNSLAAKSENKKEDLSNNIEVEGYYEKYVTRTEWESGPNCGSGAIICLDLFGGHFAEHADIKETYKDASDVVVKDGKVRFKLPDSILFKGDMEGIFVNDIYIGVRINAKTPYSDRKTVVTKQFREFGNKADEKLGYAKINFEKAVFYRLVLVENNEFLPIISNCGYINKSIQEVFPVLPHDAIHIEDSWTQYNIANMHPTLKEHNVTGWRVSYNGYDITGMSAKTLLKLLDIDTGGGRPIYDEVKEYRYAKDGKLFKITGSIYTEYKTGGMYYSIYFHDDGTISKTLSEAGNKYGIEEYEERIKAYFKNEHAFKVFQKSLAYVKHVLDAPRDELQKEFDDYKNAAPLLKEKTK